MQIFCSLFLGEVCSAPSIRGCAGLTASRLGDPSSSWLCGSSCSGRGLWPQARRAHPCSSFASPTSAEPPVIVDCWVCFIERVSVCIFTRVCVCMFACAYGCAVLLNRPKPWQVSDRGGPGAAETAEPRGLLTARRPSRTRPGRDAWGPRTFRRVGGCEGAANKA